MHFFQFPTYTLYDGLIGASIMRAALYFSKLRRGEEKHEQREF